MYKNDKAVEKYNKKLCIKFIKKQQKNKKNCANKRKVHFEFMICS